MKENTYQLQKIISHMLRNFLFKTATLGMDEAENHKFLDAIVPLNRAPLTTGSELRVLTLDLYEKAISTQIWTYWREKFPRTVYFQGAHALILIFDLSKPSTLVNLRSHITQIPVSLCAKECRYIVVGNNSGNSQTNSIAISEFRKLAQTFFGSDVEYFEISGLERDEIMRIFESIIFKLVEVEKRCNNCYKIFDKVRILDGYLFCESCSVNPDISKARAFIRVHGSS